MLNNENYERRIEQAHTRSSIDRAVPLPSSGCLSGLSLVLPPPAPPVDNSPPPDDSPPPEPETQKDSEPTDLFASVVVGPPPRTLPPPRPPLLLPPPATASSSTKSKTAGSKKAEPHAMYTTPVGIYTWLSMLSTWVAPWPNSVSGVEGPRAEEAALGSFPGMGRLYSQSGPASDCNLM
ncbi:hypothetical protein B0H14DRAFT_2651033 [Mycena olivaceomarginata]|nr:hypothetical protein B0H14DRAFT_2651033 [Mycena olivaceomarginata]